MGLILGYTNQLPGASSMVVTPSSSSVTPTSRLTDGRPSEVYRWTHSGSGDPLLIDAEFTDAFSIRVVALINTSLPPGTVVEIDHDLGSASGEVVRGPDVRNHVSIETGPDVTNGLVIKVSDTGGAVPAGEYSIGQVWASAGYVPPWGWRRSFESDYIDPSEPGRAVRGDVFEYPGRPYRRIKLETTPLATAAAETDWRRVRHACAGGRRVLVHEPDQVPAFGYVSAHSAMEATAAGAEAGLTVSEVL